MDTNIQQNGQQANTSRPIPHAAPSSQQQKIPSNPNNQLKRLATKGVLKKFLPEKYFKRAGLGCALIIGTMLGFGLVYVTGLDTIFFKLKMEGLVVNANGLVPIENAKLIVNGKVKATTNEEGYYKMTGLNRGDLDLTVQAEGFFDKEFTVKLDRNTNNYTTVSSFALDSSEVGTLSGRFIIDKIGYDFSEDKIKIGEQVHTINTDGSFEIQEIPIGEITFTYESTSYFDISQNITLSTGENKLKNITLEPSGDIDERFLDYITGLPISNVEIEANNILDSQIEITQDGNLKIKDLEIGKSYLLRISSDGYITRDYELIIEQGVNRIPNLAMVELGEVFYIDGTDEDKDFQIFSSEYDGENLEQRTTLDKLEPFRIYQDEESVRFLSSVDKLRGLSSRVDVPIMYQLNTTSNEITKVTSNIAGLDNVFIDTSKSFFINVYKADRRDVSSTIEIRNQDGSVANTVDTIDSGTITNALVSSDGKFAYYEANNALYVWNNSNVREIISGEEVKLQDISDNGNIILFTLLESTGFYTLNSYNFATKEIRVLNDNTFGRLFSFIDDSDNSFIYVDSFNDKESIYVFDIRENNSTKLVDLQQKDTLESYRVIDSNIFYVTKNKGLSVLDMKVPRVYVPTNTNPFIFF